MQQRDIYTFRTKNSSLILMIYVSETE